MGGGDVGSETRVTFCFAASRPCHSVVHWLLKFTPVPHFKGPACGGEGQRIKGIGMVVFTRGEKDLPGDGLAKAAGIRPAEEHPPQTLYLP